MAISILKQPVNYMVGKERAANVSLTADESLAVKRIGAMKNEEKNGVGPPHSISGLYLSMQWSGKERGG